jgi:hypothetical protein
MHAKHLTYMVGGAAAAFAVMLLVGVPLAKALPYALLLACPLMMIAMMASMRRGDSHGVAGHDRTQDPATDQPGADPTYPPAGSER